jgi:diketogulonate reductase-like aldo/keto reductase
MAMMVSIGLVEIVVLVEASETTILSMQQDDNKQDQQHISVENKSDNNNVNRRNISTDFPLVGVGVGNLRRHLVDSVVTSSLDMGFQLVDTARASRNEHVIAKTVSNYICSQNANVKNAAGDDHGSGGDDDEDVRRSSSSSSTGGGGGVRNHVHVITKVWYTHLGYERTKLSVQESMQDMLSAIQSSNDNHQDASKHTIIHLHVLLHWPRCNDRIEWMKCQEEEDALPQYVKDAGPPPHLDKENAWKGSWRALEDVYLEQQQQQQQHPAVVIESIGVSNFEMQDMKTLLKECRVKPFWYQGNVWIVLHNPNLFNLLHENGIVFQAYNVMNGILQRKGVAPRAFSVLSRIAQQLKREKDHDEIEHRNITEAMVVMAWLVQEGISVIPRASSLKHLLENSPWSIASVPALTREEKDQIRAATSALMRGEDITIDVMFRNELSVPVKIHWRNSQTGQEFAVIENLESGAMSNTIQTHPGHVFVAYDENQKNTVRKELKVTVSYGEQQYFIIDDGDDEL